MGTPNQSLAMGHLQSRFQQEVQFYLSQQVVTRLWNKDVGLWPSEVVQDDSALAKLDWVSLPEAISHFLAQLRTIFGGADSDGLCEHAVPSLESAKLCVRALTGLSGVSFARKVVILDSILPEAICDAEQQLDLARALLFVANKERYGLKDHCLFLYFQDLLQFLQGNRSAVLSRQCGPRSRIPRFRCRSAAHSATFFLSTATADRRGYLGLLASPSLQAYAKRLGQMIGGSLAQRKHGLFPLVGMNPQDVSSVENDAALVALSYAADNVDELEDAIQLLQAHSTPLLHIRVHLPPEPEILSRSLFYAPC